MNRQNTQGLPTSGYLNELACKQKTTNSLLQQIKDLLANPITNPVPDPEVVCLSNDGGATVISGWEVFDVSTITPTSTLYINGIIATGYVVVPCGIKAKYDYEESTICVDGQKWTRVHCFDPSSGVPQLVTTLWLDQTSTPTTAPLQSLIDNVNCNSIATPLVVSTTADTLSLLQPSHSYSIKNTTCCFLTITTDIGSFIVLPNSAEATEKVDGLYSITGVSFNTPNTLCDLSKVYITGWKTN